MTAKELIEATGGLTDWRTLLARLAKYLNCKQIIEMGAELGYSTKFILEAMPINCRLYSIEINPDKAWVMTGEDKRLVKIIGDDCDMNIWKRRRVDLKKTDLWEIDSDHTYEHICKQWEFYSPHFKKGAVIAIDDTVSTFEGVMKFWSELKGDKYALATCGIIVI